MLLYIGGMLAVKISNLFGKIKCIHLIVQNLVLNKS